MKYFIYAFVSIIEGFIFYFILTVVFNKFDNPMPPIGSNTFYISVILWPLIAPAIRPGIRTMPVIGELFSAIEGVATIGFHKSSFAKDNLEENEEISEKEIKGASQWVLCALCNERIERNKMPAHRTKHTGGLNASEIGVVPNGMISDEKTIKCNFCNFQVHSSKFRLHLEAHKHYNTPEIDKIDILNDSKSSNEDINTTDSDGMTALMHACIENDINYAKILIEKGIDINARDNMGATALTYAVSEDNVIFTEMLIESGAYTNIRINDGRPLLVIAANNGACKTTEILLNYGLNVNQRDLDGFTPLMNASSGGCFPPVKLL